MNVERVQCEAVGYGHAGQERIALKAGFKLPATESFHEAVYTAYFTTTRHTR